MPARVLIPALALLALLAAAYAPALQGRFLWDDDLHITANPTIVGPLGLKEIWTTARANYFPLVLTNFWVQHALWGAEPLGYRLVTLAFHLGAALLLWRVLVGLRVPPLGAWLGAALWALHPVQVESVAWICELKNTQSAVFFLAAILLWLRWLEAGPARGRYWAALACALLALLSKPSTVMLPVALALCTWHQRGRLGWRDLAALAPFLALSAAAAGWTIWEQKFNSGAIGPEWAQTFPERLAIAGRAVWFYLGKLVWPEPLIFIYPRWTLGSGLDAGHLGLLAIGATLAIFAWRRWRGATMAALYFGALLFPVLGFFSVYFFRYSFVGDHFQYLASMGPLALLGAGLGRLSPRLALGAGGALVAACTLLTVRQAPAYLNNEALWRHTLARNPGAFMAWANLGDTLRLAKRPAEAMAAYRSALALRPADAPVLNDLGNLLVLDGRLAEALPLLERAVAAKPGVADFHLSLGNALRDFGRVAEAIAAFRRALEIEPGYGPAHNNLAIQLAKAGDNAGAASHFEAALRARPGHTATRDNLGRALMRLSAEHAAAGRWGAAAEAARRAVTHAPDSAPAHSALAAMLAQDGKLAESIPVFETAVRLDPREAEARENFGRVLSALGRHREASAQLEEAARLRREAPR
ncbi:MAG: tetratricopeptide repeat protein [Opitutaceae bacterium]|nr:tetratricopeptide repeat protein [Opitutaceae bacterium]